jgi:hypothetical protein
MEAATRTAYAPHVDPFVAVMLLLVGGLFVGVILLGIFYPGSGADQLDWRPTRSAEVEYTNELDDLEQMAEAVNSRRRARGEPELTEHGLREEVQADLAKIVARGEDALAEQDIEQMLELKNRRRARKGLEPLTRGQLERELLGEGEPE